jgi:hypothetical protein
MSPGLSSLVVRECKADNFKDCDLVFSGLDSDVAGDVGTSKPPLTEFLALMASRDGVHESRDPSLLKCEELQTA